MIVILAMMLLGCGNPTASAPTPEPTPSVTPTPAEDLHPLTASGEKWVDSATGRRVWLAGAIICCYDGGNGEPAYTLPHGWPYIDEAALEEIAQAGANYTHIRLGPAKADDDPFGGPYAHDGGWRPEYWAQVRHVLDIARTLRIYVEVDLVDGWRLRHVNTAWISFRGWCGILSDPPLPNPHRPWIEKAVDETGGFPNVIYQVGNENGVCFPAVYPAWESGPAGVRVIVKARLATRGYGDRMVGTNSEDPSIIPSMDYASFHNFGAPNAGGLPTQLNEYVIHTGATIAVEQIGAPPELGQYTGKRSAAVRALSRPVTPEEYRDRLEATERTGVTVHLWRSTLADKDWQRALGYLHDWRKRHP